MIGIDVRIKQTVGGGEEITYLLETYMDSDGYVELANVRVERQGRRPEQVRVEEDYDRFGVVYRLSAPFGGGMSISHEDLEDRVHEQCAKEWDAD